MCHEQRSLTHLPHSASCYLKGTQGEAGGGRERKKRKQKHGEERLRREETRGREGDERDSGNREKGVKEEAKGD